MMNITLNYCNMTDILNAVKFSNLGGHGRIRMSVSGELRSRLEEKIEQSRISRGLKPIKDVGISVQAN